MGLVERRYYFLIATTMARNNVRLCHRRLVMHWTVYNEAVSEDVTVSEQMMSESTRFSLLWNSYANCSLHLPATATDVSTRPMKHLALWESYSWKDGGRTKWPHHTLNSNCVIRIVHLVLHFSFFYLYCLSVCLYVACLYVYDTCCLIQIKWWRWWWLLNGWRTSTEDEKSGWVSMGITCKFRMTEKS